ncbi:transmembrane 7 superfamily member 3-like [Anopheles bellator]|uniref:transmembrane 7 superfamily member 3-like n=1 Tax=Anopheles bellator TaxID=139047 RepID=UPI002648F4C2|nr:transmembrane 7 superfamily member 3-like [Anopheles bellator]
MNDINDYREILLPAYSNTRIRLTHYAENTDKNVGYALVQLNAYEYNVTLSYNSTLVDGGHLTGQNLGLVLYGDGDLYAFNLNPTQPVWVSLVLMIYNVSAPVPGGCNLEFPVETSPILNITVTPDIIVIDTPPAAVARTFQDAKNACGKARLQYESYYNVMASHDFTLRSYFNAIRSLISYANAKTNGHQNTLSRPLEINRREYGRQTGRGMVFVTVVIDPVHRGFSLYVPTYSYSCQPFIELPECYGHSIPWRMLALMITCLAALEIVVGWLPVIVKSPILMGALFVLLGILGLQHVPMLLPSATPLLMVAFVVGVAVGLLLAMFAPQASHILCACISGYLIVLTQIGLINGNYYTIPNISCYMLLGGCFIGVLLSFTLNIVLISRSVIFGAICLFYGINAMFSGRLDYPLRHPFHRLYVPNYETVHYDPRLDEIDCAALAAFMIILIVCLFLRSRYQPNTVQSDFDLPCGGAHMAEDDDRAHSSAVIAADDTTAYERFGHEQPIITRWASGEDDVFESPASNSRFFRRLMRQSARR